MKTNRIFLTFFTLITAIAAASPVWAKKDPPAVNDDGMVLVENSELASVYADPGADLGVYKRFILLDATVAFKKRWQRDQNFPNPLKVKDSDMLKIQEDVASLFREVFTKELVDGGYTMADEPGPDVLLIKPAIVDLDVEAPDVQSSTRTYSYSRSAGEMTLNLELFDSVTDDKIVKATDRKRDYDSGYTMRWRTSVSNRSDAKRMMTAWAKALRDLLDEARKSTTPASE
jgi:hypothetical protein